MRKIGIIGVPSSAGAQGTLYSPQELVQRVTGEPLNPDHFIDYLKTKYRAIYQIN